MKSLSIRTVVVFSKFGFRGRGWFNYWLRFGEDYSGLVKSTKMGNLVRGDIAEVCNGIALFSKVSIEKSCDHVRFRISTKIMVVVCQETTQEVVVLESLIVALGFHQVKVDVYLGFVVQVFWVDGRP